MQLEIIQIKQTQAITAGGKSYKKYEVTFKDLGKNAVSSKVVTSFSAQPVVDTLSVAQPGSVFEVSSQQNKAGFWEWTAMTPVAPGAVQVTGTIAGPTFPGQLAKAPGKSTYETPEERAKRQVYIIKQSSIANAIALLSVGAKSAPTLGAVLDMAQSMSNFILNTQLVEIPNDNPDIDTLTDIPH